MNRYGVAGYVGIVAAGLLALWIGLAGREDSQVILRGVGIILTLPLALIFSPFVVRVIRGRGKDGSPLQARDNLGAGISLFSAGFAILYIRAAFFSTDATCGGNTDCYGWVLGAAVFVASAGAVLKGMAAAIYLFPTDGRYRAVVAFVIGLIAAILAIGFGL